MLDPTLLRHNPAELAARLRQARGYELDASALESLEAERKQIQVRTQELQNLRNTRSKAIGQAKAKGEDVAALMAEVAGIGDRLKANEQALAECRSVSPRCRLAFRTCRPRRLPGAPEGAGKGQRNAGG